MANKLKTAKQMERNFKGMANHYRIEILLLVEDAIGVTVDEIAKQLEANFKTISQHTRSLVHTGLLRKQYKGREVQHELSPYGKRFVQFIKAFQRINE